MRRRSKAVTLAFTVGVLGLFAGGFVQSAIAAWPPKDPAILTQLKSFAVEKEDQAGATNGHVLAEDVKAFFAAAEKGDWLTASNKFKSLGPRVSNSTHADQTAKADDNIHGTEWEAIRETWGGFQAFAVGEEKYSALFGRNVIDSVPAGSVYFGGTDSGRFIVTALQTSQVKGSPFFTLTQNQLVDSGYMAYARGMYSHNLSLPTDAEIAQCVQDFYADLTKRAADHQLRPGESVTTNAQGRLQASGSTAVMGLNALIAKIIFDKNPDRSFYVEQSFPLDWMYPYLEPHGLIFKLNRHPLDALSEEVVQEDHNYWGRLLRPMIGSWLSTDTSVAQLTAFAERVVVKRNLSGFDGDRSFAQNTYAQKLFAKERSSIGSLYAWRATHTENGLERKRLRAEADIAFRQSFALCPYSPEAVMQLIALLYAEQRTEDMRLIVDAAIKAVNAKLDDNPDDVWLGEYLVKLKDRIK